MKHFRAGHKRMDEQTKNKEEYFFKKILNSCFKNFYIATKIFTSILKSSSALIFCTIYIIQL